MNNFHYQSSGSDESIKIAAYKEVLKNYNELKVLKRKLAKTITHEFRAARKVSEDIGAQLVLGDRPIEITLERAWKSLTWDQKTKLVISLFRGITSTTDTPQDEKTAVSPYELYQKLSTSYPSLLQPLIHERDMFLAWSLKRSKAVNKSKTVVGVVGKGHMNGIVYALISDQGDLRFRDLVGRASSDTWVSSLIKGLVRDTIIGLALWALYEQLQDYR